MPSWRDTATKQSIAEFVAAVTDRGSPDFVPDRDRMAVFDNDGTLWTERPVYARAGLRARPGSPSWGIRRTWASSRAGGMAALIDLVRITHAGITTAEFDALCRWLASARHPRFGRPYPAVVYQPMLELLTLLDRNGFSCWIFSGGGTDFMRTWASGAPASPPHRVIGSVGGHRVPGRRQRAGTPQDRRDRRGRRRPAEAQLDPSAREVSARSSPPGTPTATWPCSVDGGGPAPHPSLVVDHTDGEREYAYDRDPILGSGTGRILAGAAEHGWPVIDMAVDWATVHPATAGGYRA